MARRYSVDTRRAGKVIELLRVDEVKANIARITKAMEQADLGAVAVKGAQLTEANARAQHWPKDAIDSIFVYSKLARDESRRPSALFGFRKRGKKQPWAPGYREWFPARSKSTRAKSLVLPGFKGKDGSLQKIGMSLATMFEFGTSKMRARPAMRQALATLRTIYGAELGVIFRKILTKHAVGGGR